MMVNPAVVVGAASNGRVATEVVTRGGSNGMVTAEVAGDEALAVATIHRTKRPVIGSRGPFCCPGGQFQT